MKRFLTMLVVLFAVFTLQFATPTYAQTPAITVEVSWTHPGPVPPHNEDLAGFEVRAYEVRGPDDFIMDVYYDSNEDGTRDSWGTFDDVPDPNLRTVTFDIADIPSPIEFKVSALSYDFTANKSIETFSETITLLPLAPDAPGQVIIVTIGTTN